MAEASSVFGLLINVLWFVGIFAVAAAAFFRFRATPSGLLIGGGFGLLGVKGVIVQLLMTFVMRGSYGSSGHTALMIGSVLLNLLLVLLIAVGVVLIPRSLGQLAAPER